MNPQKSPTAKPSKGDACFIRMLGYIKAYYSTVQPFAEGASPGGGGQLETAHKRAEQFNDPKNKAASL